MSLVLGWIKGWFWDVVRQLYTNVGWLFIFGNKEPSMLWKSFFLNLYLWVVNFIVKVLSSVINLPSYFLGNNSAMHKVWFSNT
jgi:hypothetical protein